MSNQKKSTTLLVGLLLVFILVLSAGCGGKSEPLQAGNSANGRQAAEGSALPPDRMPKSLRS